MKTKGGRGSAPTTKNRDDCEGTDGTAAGTAVGRFVNGYSRVLKTRRNDDMSTRGGGTGDRKINNPRYG